MSEQESGGEVVSLAERRAQKQAREAAKAKQDARARAQASSNPKTLPKPWLTYAIIGANVLMWLVMVGAGVDGWEPTNAQLRPWGANDGLRTVNGEWWRPLSAMFIHRGITHIALNMLFLWIVGRIAEQIYGRAAFALLYFGSGLLGYLASMAWHPAAVSAGASGAVFGIFGAFLAATLRRRSALPEDYVRMVRRNALLILAVNLVVGVVDPEIDLMGHIGGLATGFGLGYLLALMGEREVHDAHQARRVKLTALGAGTMVTATLFVAGALALPRWDNPTPVLDQTDARHDSVIEAYWATQDDRPARIELIEGELLPMLDQNRAALDALGAMPEKLAAVVERKRRYYDLAAQAFRRELEGLRNDDERAIAEAEDIYADAMAALRGDED